MADEEVELKSSTVSLAVVTEQHIARREAGFAEAIKLEYVILDDKGRPETRTLELAKATQVTAVTRAHHANMNYRRMLDELVGEEEAAIFYGARRPDRNGRGPTEVEVRAIWEIVGIEYAYFDAAGLARLETTYARFREAQVKQRRMLKQSTKKIEAKGRKKKSGKAKKSNR